MSNQKSIRQPLHDRIQLSNGAAYVVPELTTADGTVQPFVRVTAQRLDANDAIRLAAFLNRFYAEQEAEAQRADVRAERRAAAARRVK